MIAIIPAVFCAIFFENYLDDLNEWLNVLQALVLPFAVVPLVALCSKERVLGPAFRLGRLVCTILWEVRTARWFLGHCGCLYFGCRNYRNQYIFGGSIH